MTRTVLTGGVVFDGTGAAPSPADVAIEDGHVVEVGSGLDGDESIDCTDKLVTPGLIDCHVHFMADGNFSPTNHAQTPFSMNFFNAAERMERTLACGITSVREAGGTDLGVKEARDNGLIAGPKMQLSIAILSQTGGHGDKWAVCGAHMPGMMDCHPGRPHNIVDGPEEMRKKVRELIRAGADVIKVCTSGGVLSPRDDPQHPHFMPDELDVLVAEAKCCAPVRDGARPGADGIKNAVRAGIRSIEHGIFMDDEAIEMMLEAGTWLVPTLIAPGVLEAADAGIDMPAAIIQKAATSLRSTVNRSRCIEAGVKIAMGTDSGVTPHGRNLTELSEMTSLGMSDQATWEASTRVAAELMGVDDTTGTLQAGKVADIAIWDGTDLDVADLKARVHTVIQDGKVVVNAA